MAAWRSRGPEAVTALLTIGLTVATLTLQFIASALTVPNPGLTPLLRGVAVGLGIVSTLTFALLLYRVVRSRKGKQTALTIIVVLSVLASFPFSGWSLMGLALAAVMLRFPMPYGLVAAVLVEIGGIAFVERFTTDIMARLVIPIVGILVGLIIYSLSRLVVVLRELEMAREHLARLEVDGERHRISRDLHDIMGRALVTASLRNQTALRLIERDPMAAHAQLLLAEENLSNSQAQLRNITSGPTTTSLEDELESAKRLCGRLNIDFYLEADFLLTDDTQSQIAALVVREAVTNMLKHSRPSSCWITLRRESDEVVLSIVNDGVHAGQRTPDSKGTGLDDLARRVTDIGGSLEGKIVGGHRFSVVTRLPFDSEID